MVCTKCGEKLNNNADFCKCEAKETWFKQLISAIQSHLIFIVLIAFYYYSYYYSFWFFWGIFPTPRLDYYLWEITPDNIRTGFINIIGFYNPIFIFIMIIHIISIFFFLSGIYDGIILTFKGARNLTMQEEKKYLRPLFKEVYAEALKYNSRLTKRIKLKIVDDLTIESFAINNYVIISKGAVDTFSAEEIKGVFAHEIAHISNHFTKMLSFVQASTLFLTWGIAFYKYITKPKNMTARKNNSDIYTISMPKQNIIIYIINILFLMINFIFQFLYSCGRRINEVYADDFSYNLGYGEGLTSALKKIYQIELMQKLPPIQRLLRTHPPTPERIAHLERLKRLKDKK